MDAAGGPDTLRAMYAERLDEKDDHLTVVAGDGLYYLIEWTADGRHNIQGTHQYGSHMTDASSPHYLDQAEDFSRETMRSPGSTLRTDLRSLGATRLGALTPSGRTPPRYLPLGVKRRGRAWSDAALRSGLSSPIGDLPARRLPVSLPAANEVPDNPRQYYLKSGGLQWRL